MLDPNGDGNPLDDIPRMAGQAAGTAYVALPY
jgi:hypothetical protein